MPLYQMVLHGIILYWIIPCLDLVYHIVSSLSNHNVSYHTVRYPSLCHGTKTISYLIVSYRIVSYHIVSYPFDTIISYCMVSCCIVSWCIVWYLMLCYTIFTILLSTILHCVSSMVWFCSLSFRVRHIKSHPVILIYFASIIISYSMSLYHVALFLIILYGIISFCFLFHFKIKISRSHILLYHMVWHGVY